MLGHRLVKASSWSWLIYIYKIDIFCRLCTRGSIINCQSLKSSRCRSTHGRQSNFIIREIQFFRFCGLIERCSRQLPVARPKLAALSLVILIEWQTHSPIPAKPYTKKKNLLIFCRQNGKSTFLRSRGAGETAPLQMMYGMCGADDLIGGDYAKPGLLDPGHLPPILANNFSCLFAMFSIFSLCCKLFVLFRLFCACIMTKVCTTISQL